MRSFAARAGVDGQDPMVVVNAPGCHGALQPAAAGSPSRGSVSGECPAGDVTFTVGRAADVGSVPVVSGRFENPDRLRLVDCRVAVAELPGAGTSPAVGGPAGDRTRVGAAGGDGGHLRTGR